MSAVAGGMELDALVGVQRRKWLLNFLLAMVMFAVCLTAVYYTGFFTPAKWVKAIPALQDLFGRMLPPDFSEHMSWWKPLLASVCMSLGGTFIAAVLALPLSFLGARNTSPHPGIYYVVRAGLSVMRAIPDMVAAILIVAAFGFGPLPGMLALAFHSTGVLGKFFSEIIEHVDPAPVEAVRATGATAIQTLWHGYIAVTLPQLADAAIYRWECNFRNSTLLGMIGAGGIGFQLYNAFTVLDYNEVIGITVMLVSLVILVDWLGSMLRKSIK